MYYLFDGYGWFSGESDKQSERSTDSAPKNKSLSEAIGAPRANWTGYKWVDLPYSAPVIEEPASDEKPYKWHLDVGAFFDRFSAAKMAVLTSESATAQAIVRDCQVRKWIDLKAESTAQGVAALVSLGLVSESAAVSILGNPASPSENSALRRIYYDEPM